MFFYYKFAVAAAFSTTLFNHCRSEKAKPEPLKADAVTITRDTGNFKGNTIPLKNMFGINTYEWNFLQDPSNPNAKSTIYESNMAVIKAFSAIRHYINWNKLENTKGNYTFNPTNNGGWDYDLIYTRCKKDGLLVLADIKNCPTWLVDTYPESMQDAENVPAPYGESKNTPATYADQARTAFQFAARYGYNTALNPALVKVNPIPRWANDQPNVVKIGMGLVKYIECDNERDKWWKGPAAEQTAEEYAANMSAFYDGDKGKLGKNAGVKTADPTMQVVMGGLATANADFVKKMIAWCKTNRGFKADGSIDLCFDVINYHYYNNNGNILLHTRASSGVAPELSKAGVIADSFVKLSNSLKKPLEVWVTESGYDINQGSYQKAISIGDKTPTDTQADWILRTSLLYIRHGINRLFFYQLLDDTPNVDVQYATSGLAVDGIPRPAANFVLQTNKLMGDYIYQGTINADPLVDKYTSGDKTMYVLTIPDQVDRTGIYNLNLGTAKANIYNLNKNAFAVDKTQVNTNAGKLEVRVSETPVFVEAIN